MASTLIVHCDRCGGRIEAERSLLRVEAGPLRARRHEIDLCSACQELLCAWLAECQGLRQARHEPASVAADART